MNLISISCRFYDKRLTFDFSQKRIRQSQTHRVIKHYIECEEFLRYAFNVDVSVPQSQRSFEMRSQHSSSADDEQQASFGDIDFQPSGSSQDSSASGGSGSKSPSYNFNEVETRIYQESKEF